MKWSLQWCSRRDWRSRGMFRGVGVGGHRLLIVWGVWPTLWDWNVCDLLSRCFTLPRSLPVCLSLCQTVERLVGRFFVQTAECRNRAKYHKSSVTVSALFTLSQLTLHYIFVSLTDPFDTRLSLWTCLCAHIHLLTLHACVCAYMGASILLGL